MFEVVEVAVVVVVVFTNLATWTSSFLTLLLRLFFWFPAVG